MLIFIETASRRIVEVDLPRLNNYEIVRRIRDVCHINQDGYVGLQPITSRNSCFWQPADVVRSPRSSGLVFKYSVFRTPLGTKDTWSFNRS